MSLTSYRAALLRGERASLYNFYMFLSNVFIFVCVFGGGTYSHRMLKFYYLVARMPDVKVFLLCIRNLESCGKSFGNQF